MISLSKQFIFVHVPRSGGNSIQSTLLEYADDALVRKDADMHQFELRHDEYGLSKHSRLSSYHEALGDRIYTEFFKFAVVRNPWDRILSRWFRFKYGAVNRPETRGRWIFRREVDARWDRDAFMQFINWHLERSGSEAWSIMPWISLEGEVCLDDYIVYDSLQSGYDRICSRLGLPPRELPRLNESRRSEPYQHYYDDETRRLVSEICADEIEHFGFRFDD